MRRAVLISVLAAGLLAVTACTSDQGSAGPTDPPAPSPTATDGPLVGDPTLVPTEQQCVEQNPNPPWYPTVAAFEVHDSARTHLYGCADFLGSTTGPNTVFAHTSSAVYPTPYNIVNQGPDGLFIYGGGYGDNSAATGSFVAAVEPGTLNERWRRVLINTDVTNEWNYPGVLNTLSDGSLVVIYGYHIAKLDPATGAILASTVLPTGGSDPRDTAYNGYDALPDGTIIAKTVNREKGCTEQGFSAFLQCPNPQDVPPSVMVAIDPTTLQVLSQITLPEMMGGRVTTVERNSTNDLYLPGASNLYRYTYANGSFAQDPTWGPVPYLKAGQTPGSAMAVMGDWVVAMTNGGAPTSTPMSVVAVNQNDSATLLRLDPFADAGANNSFIPSMVSVDPDNNLIYVMDAGAAKLGAVRLQGNQLSMAWTQDQTTLSFTTLIGSPDQRVLIGTDIPVKVFKQLQNYTTEAVVWRDAATGAELARTGELPKMSAGILVTPDYAGLQHFLTADGHIIDLQIHPPAELPPGS